MIHEPPAATAPAVKESKPAPPNAPAPERPPQPVEPYHSEHKGGGRATLWLLLVVAIAGGGGFFWYRHAKASAAAGKQGPPVRSIPVVVSIARRGNMDIYDTGLGSVTALNTVTVRTRIDGAIDQIFFYEGQIVHQGDILFQIDPRPYEVALTSAKAQMAKDQATLDNARVDLKRDEDAKDAIPKMTLDTQRALVKQLEAGMAIDSAAVASANLNLVYSRITAPITGRIGLRIVDIGNMVHASDTSGLAVITQLQPIAVVFNLPEDNIPQIIQKFRLRREFAFEFMFPPAVRRILDTPYLPVQAYDRDLKHKIADGWLLAIDSQIDPTTGTVRLKGMFKNEDQSLFPNQFVNARLLIDVRKDVVLIPTAAIQRSPTGNFVYVVTGLPGLPKARSGKGPATNPAAGAVADKDAGAGKMAGGKPAASRPASGPASGAATAEGGKPPEGSISMVPITVGPSEGNDTIVETGLSAGGSKGWHHLRQFLQRGHAGYFSFSFAVPVPTLPEVVVTDGVDKLQASSKVIPKLNEDQFDDSGNKIEKPADTGTQKGGNGKRGSGTSSGASGSGGSSSGRPHTNPSTESASPGTQP